MILDYLNSTIALKHSSTRRKKMKQKISNKNKMIYFKLFENKEMKFDSKTKMNFNFFLMISFE